jgi:hypothetical protein
VFRIILLLTKGIIRDMRLRRLLMFWVMMVAMVMLFAGSVLMTNDWARAHPWLYLSYWLLCGWLTLLGMMLALMDILVLRAAQRAARRVLEQEILAKKEQAKEE